MACDKPDCRSELLPRAEALKRLPMFPGAGFDLDAWLESVPVLEALFQSKDARDGEGSTNRLITHKTRNPRTSRRFHLMPVSWNRSPYLVRGSLALTALRAGFCHKPALRSRRLCCFLCLRPRGGNGRRTVRGCDVRVRARHRKRSSSADAN